jgi:hypothetical protein
VQLGASESFELLGEGLSVLHKKESEALVPVETFFPNNVVLKVDRFSRHVDANINVPCDRNEMQVYVYIYIDIYCFVVRSAFVV